MDDQSLKHIESFLRKNFEILPADEGKVESLQNRFDEMRAQLIRRIEQLIADDMEGLMNLLYRIDVNESKLKARLAKETQVDAAIVMSDMIIERQIEKIETRKKFGTGSDWSFDV